MTQTPYEALGLIMPTGPEGAMLQVRRVLPNGEIDSFGGLQWPTREYGEDHVVWIDRCIAWANRRWAGLGEDVTAPPPPAA